MRVANRECWFGSGSCASDRTIQLDGIAAHEFLSAIDNNLWSVDGAERELARIILLTLVHGVKRERIAPTKVIPVGDMFAEDDRLSAGDRLRGIKLRQERISRRTIGTSF